MQNTYFSKNGRKKIFCKTECVILHTIDTSSTVGQDADGDGGQKKWAENQKRRTENRKGGQKKQVVITAF